MKTLIVKNNIHGRTTKVNAKRTYPAKPGEWIAEVEREDFDHACFALCQGIKDCTCDNLHVEADQDDDGTEYTIIKS